MLKPIRIALIVLGSMLLFVGVFFKLTNCIDMFKGIYSGPIFLIAGIVLYLKEHGDRRKKP
jgi:hypothetical protein